MIKFLNWVVYNFKYKREKCPRPFYPCNGCIFENKTYHTCNMHGSIEKLTALTTHVGKCFIDPGSNQAIGYIFVEREFYRSFRLTREVIKEN